MRSVASLEMSPPSVRISSPHSGHSRAPESGAPQLGQGAFSIGVLIGRACSAGYFTFACWSRTFAVKIPTDPCYLCIMAVCARMDGAITQRSAQLPRGPLSRTLREDNYNNRPNGDARGELHSDDQQRGV